MKKSGVLVSVSDCACHRDILGNDSSPWKWSRVSLWKWAVGWQVAATTPILFTGIGRVGSLMLLPVISIGAGLCLRGRHTQGRAGTGLQARARVWQLGCCLWAGSEWFCRCGGPAAACGTGGDILVVHWAFGPWVEVPLPPGTVHGSVCKDLCTAWQCPPTVTFLAVCVWYAPRTLPMMPIGSAQCMQLGSLHKLHYPCQPVRSYIHVCASSAIVLRGPWSDRSSRV